MNVTRIAALGIALLSIATSARSQPEQTLKDAVLGLAVADNYTWEQVNDADTSGIRTSQRNWGKTAVDGYTVATIGGFPAVFRGNDSVFELKAGWRHVRDLAADELHQLGRALGGATAGTFVYIPIHDLLRALAAAATEVWQDGGIIKGEVPYEFERHLMTGTLPSASALRSVLGTPRRASSSRPGARVSPSLPNGSLSVWVKDGTPTKVSVEFARTLTRPSGPRKGDLMAVTRTYTVELSKLGGTSVDVPSEAKVLFVK